LDLSEVRWNELGEMRTPSGMTSSYSGRPNEKANIEKEWVFF
jgi:hypothetical protein